jgi:hypothetical protein
MSARLALKIERGRTLHENGWTDSLDKLERLLSPA